VQRVRAAGGQGLHHLAGDRASLGDIARRAEEDVQVERAGHGGIISAPTTARRCVWHLRVAWPTNRWSFRHSGKNGGRNGRKMGENTSCQGYRG